MPIRTRSRAQTQRGMTLIELMISVTIGLFMIAAIGYLYVSSRGAYRSNSAMARVQEDGRFGLDAITRDARQVGAAGCNAGANLQTVAATPLQLPGTGTAIIYNDPGLAVFGVAPSGYGFPPGPTSAFTAPPQRGTLPAPPPWLAGDVLQMVIPTSEPISLVADADPVNYTVTLSNNQAKLQPGDYLVVSNCMNASIANVIAAPTAVGTAGNVQVNLTAGTPLIAPTVVPQLTVATHATAQRIDAVTYYVGQYPGRPWSALYRYSFTQGVAEEVIDHVENMCVLYGIGAAPPVPASAILPGTWGNVTSVRISLQVVGEEQSTANAGAPVLIDPTVTTAIPAPDTRLRQIFTATAALRNRVK